MALSANTVWEVRTTGSDTQCGGGFVTGASGTDYSQQAAAQHTGTTGQNINPSTTFTDLSANFGTDVVGNILYVASGSDVTVGRYQITARTDANTISIDRACTTSIFNPGDITYYIGGALASPGAMFASLVAGNMGWIRGGSDPENNPFTITSSSSNVANGRMTLSVQAVIRGYLTTRGDVTVGGLKPVIKAGVNSITMFTSSTNTLLQDVVIDGDKTNRTGTVGTGGGSSGLFVNVTVRNCNGNGATSTNSAYLSCLVHSNAGVGISSPRQVSRTTVRDNTGNGITPASVVCIEDSLVHSNGGDGISASGSVLYVKNTLVANNTGDGLETSVPAHVQDSVFFGNGAYGINANGSTVWVTTRNVRYRSNTSGTTTGNVSQTGNANLTADPYTNSASDDYTPNYSSAGWDELFQDGVSVLGGNESIGTRDIGHYQKSAGVGGGSVGLIIGG